MNNAPKKPALLCIAGPQGAGKTILADLTADTLRRATKRDVRRPSFADPLKEIVALLTADNAFAKEKSYPVGKDGAMMSGREILQIVGTDLFRSRFREDIWVWLMLQRSASADLLVIDDARFPNERSACDFGIYLTSTDCPEQEGAAHASEAHGQRLMEMADLALSRTEGAYSIVKNRHGAESGLVTLRQLAALLAERLPNLARKD